MEAVGSLEGDWNEEVSNYSKIIGKLCLSSEAREALGRRLTL